MSPFTINLSEHETVSPDNRESLEGIFLDNDLQTRKLAGTLNEIGLIKIIETRRGVRIETGAHVGSLKIGNLTLNIQPKIMGNSDDLKVFLSLLNYTYRLNNLKIFDISNMSTTTNSFRDVLVHQLYQESKYLIQRGLQRRYVQQCDDLQIPRGRINFRVLAHRNGATEAATLPCIYHSRIENCFENQVLLAGLYLGKQYSRSSELKQGLSRLIKIMELSVSRINLSTWVLKKFFREINRQTRAYKPAIQLIMLLYEGQGVYWGEQIINLPGFLFDMNRFFQALLLRFLQENLDGYQVEEKALSMISYDRDYNPGNRRSPQPRPDYVVHQRGKVKFLLDAKYRDIGAKGLPREMLYQLIIYAVSGLANNESTILFPTLLRDTTESRLKVREPLTGKQIARVNMRPVYLPELLECIQGKKDARSLARSMVVGPESKSVIKAI